MFDWQKSFKNKNTNEMTRIITDTLMNIFNNFIPHKTKKNDYTHSEWMNSFIILADGKLVFDFKIKSELFNSHFAAQ